MRYRVGLGQHATEFCAARRGLRRRRDGAAGGDRTHDPWLRRPILYPLSYSRNFHRWKAGNYRMQGGLVGRSQRIIA